jgi:hypothetical protein
MAASVLPLIVVGASEDLERLAVQLARQHHAEAPRDRLDLGVQPDPHRILDAPASRETKKGAAEAAPSRLSLWGF